MTDNNFRYILEKGSKKYHCPECTKKRFVLYIDTQTGEYLPDHYGRCDRESKCSYQLNPYKDGYIKMLWEEEQGNETNWKPQQRRRTRNVPKPVIEFIPFDVLKQSRGGYESNVFIQNLLSRVPFPFKDQDIEKMISQYHLGTVQNGYRKGSNTFPFIDIKGNIRAVQVKQFDEQNHTTGTDFLHSIIEKRHTRNNKPLPAWLEEYQKNDVKVSCLFGEHLLSKYPYNPIALVEAPKTAIYGTLYFGFPEEPTNLLWLAVYNLSSLNLNKCKALKGRNVYLFPDLSKGGTAFELWSKKAGQIQSQLKGTQFTVSNLLERSASSQDKEKGKDIADYLISQDWRLFRKQETPIRDKSESTKDTFFLQPEPLPKVENLTKPHIEPLENGDKYIAELENYFAGIILPTQPIKLNSGSTINDCSLFIESHFAIIKANKSRMLFSPYLSRLKELKKVITQKHVKLT